MLSELLDDLFPSDNRAGRFFYLKKPKQSVMTVGVCQFLVFNQITVV